MASCLDRIVIIVVAAVFVKVLAVVFVVVVVAVSGFPCICCCYCCHFRSGLSCYTQPRFTLSRLHHRPIPPLSHPSHTSLISLFEYFYRRH